MKKNRQILKIFLIGIISSLLLFSCTTYTIHDNRVRVHYIEQGEKAPFNGYLLNNYTYQKLKNIANDSRR